MLKFTKSPVSTIASVILFGLLLVLLLWVNIFQQLKKEKDAVLNKAKELNANQVLALESYTIRTIQNADLIIQIIRSEYEKQNTFNSFQQLKQNSTIDQKLLEGVVILDAGGNLVSSFHPLHPDSVTNFRTKEYFQPHLSLQSDSLLISKPIISRLFSKAVIVLSRRVNDPVGNFAGVIALQIFPETFTSFSDGAFVDSFDIVSLIAPDGTTYARKTGSIASYGENIRKSPLFEHLKSKSVDNYFSEDAIRNIPTHFSYRKLKNYPIIATVGKREKDVFRYYEKQKTKSLIFTAAITLLIILFLVAIIIGILNRRRFFYALSESEQKYRSMFEKSRDAILLTDLQGNIITLNPAAFTVFHLEQKAFALKNIGDFLVNKDDNFYTKADYTGELKFKTKSGDIFTGEVVSSQYRTERDKFVSVIVIRDASERVQLQEELANERNQRDQLILQQIILAQEIEREQIGGELHDNVCQILATTKHYLELIERKQEFSQTFLPQARQMISDSILEIRRLSHAMNTASLDSKTITDALQELTASIQATGELKVEFTATDCIDQLDQQKKRALYRIAQEQLNNVQKHAEATIVKVGIAIKDDSIYLTIADNGKGFDPLQQKAGLGLNNMEARVKAFAGKIRVATAPGKGCLVEAIIPYRKETA